MKINMESMNFKQFFDFKNSYKQNRFWFNPTLGESIDEPVSYYKKGNKIHIKKANRGKFTEYCGGNVTSECIQRGKNSSDPKIRKRATFAANARKWKHCNGGTLRLLNSNQIDFSYLFNKK